MHLLQDGLTATTSRSLGISLHKEIIMVGPFLEEKGAAGLLKVSSAPEDPYSDYTKTQSGLRYKVLRKGSGSTPSVGQSVDAHYTGWLDGFDSDNKFDSSRDRGDPFRFNVGVGEVIKGWDEGFLDMMVGERWNLIIHPDLGYGERGAGIIKGGSTLYFDVELLGIRS